MDRDPRVLPVEGPCGAGLCRYILSPFSCGPCGRDRNGTVSKQGGLMRAAGKQWSPLDLPFIRLFGDIAIKTKPRWRRLLLILAPLPLWSTNTSWTTHSLLLSLRLLIHLWSCHQRLVLFFTFLFASSLILLHYIINYIPFTVVDILVSLSYLLCMVKLVLFSLVKLVLFYIFWLSLSCLLCLVKLVLFSFWLSLSCSVLLNLFCSISDEACLVLFLSFS